MPCSTSCQARAGPPPTFPTSRPDADGRFRINPAAADGWARITAFPPPGPALPRRRETARVAHGTLEQSVDIALPRGVSIRGKVTERASGKPVAGATVEFRARRAAESASKDRPCQHRIRWLVSSRSSPQRGLPFHQRPQRRLRARRDRLSNGPAWPAGRHAHLRARPHRARPETGWRIQGVHVALRRGVTVTGQVVAPDGQPVHDAWIISRIVLDPRLAASRNWNGRIHGNVQQRSLRVARARPRYRDPCPLPRTEA